MAHFASRSVPFSDSADEEVLETALKAAFAVKNKIIKFFSFGMILASYISKNTTPHFL